MSVLIDFYLGSGRNSDGRAIHGIWAMSDDDLMDTHDVVQWLFPLTKESNFNPDAPILSQQDITLFHQNLELHENLLTSFRRFLKVFGLRMEDGEIVGDKRYHCAKCRKRSPRPVKSPAPWYCPECLKKNDGVTD